MKKLLLCVLAIALLVSCSIVAFASENATVYDFYKLPHKEFTPCRLSQHASEVESTNGWWVASVDYRHAASDSYTDSTKATRWPIDEIYAYFRAYSGNELTYSRSDTQFNASHAAAGYEHVIMASECIGQHSFKEKGYQSWDVETYYD